MSSFDQEELAGTDFNAETGICTYTLHRNGKHWSVSIPLAELNKHGTAAGHKERRRQHLARVLNQALLGPSDEDKGMT